jgi:microcystin-dependent protein
MKQNISGFTPGSIIYYASNSIPSGWILLDGRTIGSSSSAATNRANSDTLPVYQLLWNNLANAQAPVSGGRGVSAVLDFNANKTLTLPDLRAAITVGRDNMGVGPANRLTSISSTTLGLVAGSNSVGLTTAQTLNHTHTISINTNSLPHTHTFSVNETSFGGYTGPEWIKRGNHPFNAVISTSSSSSTLIHSHSVTIPSQGSGTPHGNLQPVMVLNVLIKL